MGSLRLEGLGALAKQAAALGQDAKKAVNSALLKGARIITAEAKVRAPRTEGHPATRGRSPRHLADVLTATKITAKNVSGVTVEGGANGPSYYWKYVEYGTVKQKAQKFINESATAKEAEVLDAVTAELKSELGL